METYPEIILKVIQQFKKLPGIGQKSAERMVEALLKMPQEEVFSFAENLRSLKENVKLCKICFSLTDIEICKVCQDTTREKKLAIVEQFKDAIALEKAGFRGKYHILGGRLNPLEKIGPDNLTIQNLLERLEKEEFTEIIIATNPNPEGETTATYLSGILKKYSIPVTRLATGIPVGAEIEYIDPETIRKSIENRFKT